MTGFSYFICALRQFCCSLLSGTATPSSGQINVTLLEKALFHRKYAVMVIHSLAMLPTSTEMFDMIEAFGFA